MGALRAGGEEEGSGELTAANPGDFAGLDPVASLAVAGTYWCSWVCWRVCAGVRTGMGGDLLILSPHVADEK